MSARLSRRAALLGGGAAVVVVGGAAAGGSWAWGRLNRSADTEATDYAKFLADVHEDYVNGRVVEHNGWVLSQHEADTIDQRLKEQTQQGQSPGAAMG